MLKLIRVVILVAVGAGALTACSAKEPALPRVGSAAATAEKKAGTELGADATPDAEKQPKKKDADKDQGKKADKDKAPEKKAEDKSEKRLEDPTADDEDAKPAAPEAPPAAIAYPTLKFLGKGYSTYKNSDRLATRMEATIKADATSLRVSTTSAKVECGDLSGCKQNEVDETTNKNSLGDNVYARPTSAEIKALKSSGFRVEPGLLYANSLKAKNGKTFTITPPLPVYAWPTKLEAYASFAGGGSWTSQVTADVGVITDPDIDDEDAAEYANDPDVSAKTFSVTATARNASAGDGLIAVTIDITIAEDKERTVYEAFNVPKTATYVVDTKSRNISRSEATAWFNGNKSRREEEQVMSYKMCAKDVEGKVESFPCE